MQGKPFLNPMISRPPVPFHKVYRSQTDPHILARRLDAVAAGAFFLWLIIVLIARSSWAVGLFGAGILLLTMQAARKHWVQKWEAPWVVFGLLCLFSAVWLSFGLLHSLMPSLCVVAGASLFFAIYVTLVGNQRDDQD